MRNMKVKALILTASLILTLTACTDNDGSSGTTATTTTTGATASPETSTDTGDNAPAEGDNGQGSEANTGDAGNAGDTGEGQVSAETVLSAIRDAYGENWLSSMPITEEMLGDTYGLSADMYDDIASEMPMIGFHPDRVIVVIAKEGREADVLGALNSARETLVNDAVTYPVNIAKINSSQVVQNGNCIAFILAGAPDDRAEATEDEALSFATEQTQIGVDAFNACFAA